MHGTSFECVRLRGAHLAGPPSHFAAMLATCPFIGFGGLERVNIRAFPLGS